MATSLDNIFADSPLDRATYRRSDDGFLEKAQQEGLLLPLWRGEVFVLQQGEKQNLGFLRSGLVKPAAPIGLIFLGMDKGKEKPRSYFACPLDDRKEPTELLDMGAFSDLRAFAANASVDDSAIAAQARALTEWHKNHLFCARCGKETMPLEAGHKRFCPLCEVEHFPRTDPVVIMMITHNEKAFLGRQAAWPQGFYSALAGFIEPGETIEEAVKRESLEEANINIARSSYFSTQPWPYPYSLMIGCFAEAASLDFEIDGIELETGRWFERDHLRDLLEGKQKDFFLPPPLAIAHRLIHHFVYQD